MIFVFSSIGIQASAKDLPFSSKFMPKAAEASVQILKTDGSAEYNPYYVAHHNGDPANFHLLGMICDPFIRFETRRNEAGQVISSKYRMWFSAYQNKAQQGTYEQGIAYAESADGITWTDPKNRDDDINLIFAPQGSDAEKAFFGFNYETPAIVRHPVNGRYYMYYSGQAQRGEANDDIPYFIGLAVSDDGITDWTRYGAVFTAKEPWEQPHENDEKTGFAGGVMEPSVLYDEKADEFKMWYAALGKEDGIWSGRIGYATSDDGIHWPDDRRCKTPVFVIDQGAWDSSFVSQTHVIADPVKGYHLFYAAKSSDETIYAIGHAYSPDGIEWTRNPNNPIIRNTAQTWHSMMTGGPSAIIKDGSLLLWFFGSKEETFARVYFGQARLRMGSPRPVPAVSNLILPLAAFILVFIGISGLRRISP